MYIQKLLFYFKLAIMRKYLTNTQKTVPPRPERRLPFLFAVGGWGDRGEENQLESHEVVVRKSHQAFRGNVFRENYVQSLYVRRCF